MNSGQTVFSQLLSLLPRRSFELAVERYSGDRRVRSFSCRDQLLCRIFAQLSGRSSLRETVSCLRALGTRRYHCGIRANPARNTLARANEQRDYRIFMDAALSLIQSARLELPVDPDLRRLNVHAFALDSTTIDLCLKLFPWARFRRRKAAVKAHVLMDLNTSIPVFMRVSDAKTADLTFLDQVIPQPGAFYVMDRGYIDFARLHRFHRDGAFFITRAKRDMDFGIRERRPTTPDSPVTHDQIIRLRGPKTRKFYPDILRRIRYIVPESDLRLTFLTNHLDLDPADIALLYRKRWKIELLFKWMKQNLHIKAFFGTTPNAVKTQLWIAVLVFVLIHRLRQHMNLHQSPNEIYQVLSVTLLEKTPVNQLFSQLAQRTDEGENPKQLSMFDL